MTARSRRWAAHPRRLAPGLVLLVPVVACAEDGADPVVIFGPEVGAEQQSLEEAFDVFTAETGIEVEVVGSGDFAVQIGRQVRAGDPPDIAMFSQPGLLDEHEEAVAVLPEDIATTATANFDPGFLDLATYDGDLKALPVKADLKSLVWYSPSAFVDAGYEVPESFDDFLELADTMVADGIPPFCSGLESGDASGWPLTDWIEDFLLRVEGPDFYDRWYRHEIPFDHPAVVEVVGTVVDLWSDSYVYGGPEASVVTPFADAGLPLTTEDCMMHRQSNFYMTNWPGGTALGDDGDISAFRLPGSEDYPNVTLTGGMYAAAFRADPDVLAVMEFLAGTDYADSRARNEIGGFLSPNRNVDVDAYPDELSRTFGEILAEADPVRYDASDLMPGTVGSGTFWTAAVDLAGGTKDVDQALGEVEASWPET